MADEFEVTWEADDGYCGGSRPHHFDISPDDIDPDMSESDLAALFWEEIEGDFQNRVHAVCDQESEFIEWAKGVQAERRAEAEAE